MKTQAESMNIKKPVLCERKEDNTSKIPKKKKHRPRGSRGGGAKRARQQKAAAQAEAQMRMEMENHVLNISEVLPRYDQIKLDTKPTYVAGRNLHLPQNYQVDIKANRLNNDHHNNYCSVYKHIDMVCCERTSISRNVKPGPNDYRASNLYPSNYMRRNFFQSEIQNDDKSYHMRQMHKNFSISQGFLAHDYSQFNSHSSNFIPHGKYPMQNQSKSGLSNSICKLLLQLTFMIKFKLYSSTHKYLLLPYTFIYCSHSPQPAKLSVYESM